MTDKTSETNAHTYLDTSDTHSLVKTFADIASCACAILDPVHHAPVVYTGWRKEWAEFSSILPHTPERLSAALARLNWADIVRRPFLKFESSGHIMHVVAPVIDAGKLHCFVYAGYVLSARPNFEDYTGIASDRGFQLDAFLRTIKELPVLSEAAITTSLVKLATQLKAVFAASTPTEPVETVPQAQAAPVAPPAEQQPPIQQPPQHVAGKQPEHGMQHPIEHETHASVVRSLTRDIRTALNGSIGVMGMLMRQRDPEILELLETMHRSNDNLLTLLDNLHDYYDLLKRKLVPASAPFDLPIAIEQAVDNPRKRAKEAGMEVNIRLAPDLPHYISSDIDRFKQVLRSAVCTVLRYSVEGKVVIAARRGATKQNGTEIQFLIQNDSASKEPQNSKYPSSVYDSDDVSMLVSKELARLLGGRLAEQIDPAAGIAFTITAPELKFEGLRFDTTHSAKLRRHAVIIILPDTPGQSATGVQCSYWGCPVKSFDSADDAFTWINSSHPADIVIIADELPSKEVFISRLRSSRLHATLPVVVYSAHAPAPGSERGKYGEYFASWDTLRETMEKALSSEHSQAPEPDSVNLLADIYPNNIMVVEDDAMNRHLVQKILKKLGYTPVLAKNGIEAVKEASQKEFDIIFMDLQMPGMDGITACKTILNDPVHGTIPKVIALSANASNTDREGAFKAGMIDFLSKPVILDNLQASIMKWGMPAHSSAGGPDGAAESVSTNADIVDVDVILQTRELDQFSEESILDRLIHAFMKEAPPLIHELEDGFTSNSAYKVTKAATTLIGMCRNLGLKEFASIAKKIDTECGTCDIAEMTHLIKLLRESFKRTSAELKQFLS